jgi:sugar/nucleoside kinase (ribokinase family)
MTITVIGHLSVDEIHPPAGQTDKTVHEDLGGIIFSLSTLAALAGPKDTIHPVFGVGDKDYETVKQRLEEFPNVDPGGIFKFKGDTNRVLFFEAENKDSRVECSKSIADPITFNRIKPYLDTDGILINMVSGSDITLETMDKIRMAVRDSKTPIHFDFHSLTLGIDPELKRFRRPLTDWRRWCFMLSSIQMSEQEALGLTAEHFDETTLVNHLMPLMVNALLFTRGERGVTAILQDNKKLTRHDFAATVPGPAVDTIGCGDVFGAAFFQHYLRQKDFVRATEFANRVAGLKSTVKGIRSLPTLLEPLLSGAVTQ